MQSSTRVYIGPYVNDYLEEHGCVLQHLVDFLVMKWWVTIMILVKKQQRMWWPIRAYIRSIYNFLTFLFCFRYDPIQPSDATINHLVAYDKDKDLLPLILSHRDYAMETEQGTSHTFNLTALQRQIEECFLRGRPKIIR